MLEKNIESHLRDRVKELGGIAYKWVSPGNSGVPDRIVVLPGNKVVFVELKAPGKKPTALQVNQHKKLSQRGCDVRVIDSKEQVDLLLQELV
ncbi:VRR-NUC domain protein [compost metagenome]